MYNDTIAAIATAAGEGALGIVRLSGPEAKVIAQEAFSSELKDHQAVYGSIRNSAGQTVDEAIALYFAEPHSYTCEEMVEFTCHGGSIPLQQTLEVLLKAGARQADPGEFTMRAFLNGRIDLAQAESVLDVIQAKTGAGLRIALQGLEGKFSQQVRDLRSELIEPLAYLTALVDFPEDEVGHEDIAGPLEGALSKLENLAMSADQGIIYRQGIRVAIAGRPNAGKSSLLNRLLGRDRAIVTPIAGTTRDTVEETANIQGIPFVLTDTAGIGESDDQIERLGIERSKQAIKLADLALFVLDSSQPVTELDRMIAGLLPEERTLVVANKHDLPPQLTGQELADCEPMSRWQWVWTSALTEKGLDALQQAMVDAVFQGHTLGESLPASGNPRHKAALLESQTHLAAALESYRSGLQADFVAIDLTAAINALGQITGETVDEELLDRVFSKFCIGK